MTGRRESSEATFDRVQQTLALRTRLLSSMGVGQLTLDGHPDVNARDPAGRTPALHTRSIETFQLLVLAGADPLVRDNCGCSAFDLAIERKCDQMAVDLLRLHPGLAPSAEALDAAFVAAVRKNCARTVKKLAEMGADIGQKPDGRTLLQCAPRGAEELKRVLRALKSCAQISCAMEDLGAADDATPPSPVL